MKSPDLKKSRKDEGNPDVQHRLRSKTSFGTPAKQLVRNLTHDAAHACIHICMCISTMQYLAMLAVYPSKAKRKCGCGSRRAHSMLLAIIADMQLQHIVVLCKYVF